MQYETLSNKTVFSSILHLFYIFCFELCFFFRSTKNIFVTCVIGSLHRRSDILRLWFPQVTVTAYRGAVLSQKFNMCDFVASTQVFNEKAEIACEHWCPSIHREKSSTVVRPANTCMETSIKYLL